MGQIAATLFRNAFLLREILTALRFYVILIFMGWKLIYINSHNAYALSGWDIESGTPPLSASSEISVSVDSVWNQC